MGRSPLHALCYRITHGWDTARAFNLLLESGADVNTQIEPYGSPLQAIIHCILIEARLGSIGRPDAIATAECFSEGPIMGRIKHLLDRGADVNSHGGIYGSPLVAALHIGAHSPLDWQREAVIELLLDRGAKLELDVPVPSLICFHLPRPFRDPSVLDSMIARLDPCLAPTLLKYCEDCFSAWTSELATLPGSIRQKLKRSYTPPDDYSVFLESTDTPLGIILNARKLHWLVDANCWAIISDMFNLDIPLC